MCITVYSFIFESNKSLQLRKPENVKWKQLYLNECFYNNFQECCGPNRPEIHVEASCSLTQMSGHLIIVILFNMCVYVHKEQLKSDQTHTKELVVLATLMRTNADYVTVLQTLFCGTCSSFKFEFTSLPVNGCYRKLLKSVKVFCEEDRVNKRRKSTRAKSFYKYKPK